MLTISDKLDLITRGFWDYKDIMTYFPKIKSPATAIKIKKKAANIFDGRTYSERYATVESIFKCLNIDRNKEIELLRKALNDEKELHERELQN